LGRRLVTTAAAWTELGLVRQLVRFRVVVVLGLACAQAVLDRSAVILDYGYFAAAGRVLLSSEALHAFADPAVQSGPFQIGLFGASDLMSSMTDHLYLALVVEGALALAVMLMLRWMVPGRAGLQLLGGLAVLGMALPSTALTDGHPAQLVIPLMWLCSATLAWRRHPAAAGLLLGLSAGWEVWGLLGVPVLLLGAGWRSHATAATTAALVVAAVFAPFLLAGHFHSGDFTWTVHAGSVPSLVMAPGTAFGWPLRVVQALAAVIAGTLVVLSRRDDPAMAVWSAPLVIIATRLTLEPLATGYYWLAPQLLGVVGLVVVLAHRRRTHLAVAACLPLFAGVLPDAATAAVTAGLLLVGVLPRRLLTSRLRPAEDPSRSSIRGDHVVRPPTPSTAIARRASR
jgi:hypothetical protein